MNVADNVLVRRVKGQPENWQGGFVPRGLGIKRGLSLALPAHFGAGEFEIAASEELPTHFDGKILRITHTMASPMIGVS